MLTVVAVLVLTGCSGPPSSATQASPPPSRPTATPGVHPVSPTPQPTSTVHVVALGDSVTAGTNCDCTSFPELYATGLEDREPVIVRLSDEGESGATSADLLAELPGLKSELGQADTVLITIGANDFVDSSDALLGLSCGGDDDLACTRTELTVLGQNLRAILAGIRVDRGGRPTTILVTGYWNVFEDGDVATHDYTGAGQAASVALTLAANEVIESSAVRSGARYVDLYAPFDGDSGERDPTRLLADDGDHPNAAGHQVIARVLLAATPSS